MRQRSGLSARLLVAASAAAVVVAALAPAPARADEGSPTGEAGGPLAALGRSAFVDPVRYRHEYRDDGDLDAATDDSDHRDLFKLGIGIDARLHEAFRARLTGRITRTWGFDNQNKTARVNAVGQDHLDFFEAFVELGPVGPVPVAVTVGRQLLLFGDGRLLGPNEFGLNTRRWDSVKAVFDVEGLEIVGFYGREVRFFGHDDRNLDRPANTVDVFGAWAAIALGDLSLEPFAFFKHDDNDDVLGERGRREHHFLRAMPGVRLDWALPLDLRLRSESALQLGEVGPDEVFAWALVNRLDWSAPEELLPLADLRVEYSVASGDTNPSDGRVGTFDAFFPVNHKWQGENDFVGLQNVHVLHAAIGLEAPPFKLREEEGHADGAPAQPVWGRAVDTVYPERLVLRLEVGFYAFWLAAKKDAWFNAGLGAFRRDTTGGSGRELGQEIDAALTIGPLRAVYAHYFPGRFARRTTPAGGRASGADLFYLEVLLRF